MPQTACRNSKPFRFQDLSKIGIFASRTGSSPSPPPPSYDNQSLQLFSGSIHLRPMKLGMLVYHIIAQGQFFYFVEIRNIFRKIAFFRIFWDLVNFTAYRHQFITIYSYTIHLRSIKLGMLVYHIIAQGQIYWFFGNSNYFSKKFVFSGFLGLGQFHLIPASLLQLIAVLFVLTGSLIIAQGQFCVRFLKFRIFFEKIRNFKVFARLGKLHLAPAFLNSGLWRNFCHCVGFCMLRLWL